MKHSLLLAGALLTLGATTVHAQLNLAWNDCLAPAGTGCTNANFACNTNAGQYRIYASAITPADIVGVTGETSVIDLASNGFELPAWWQFAQQGSCRSTGSLSVDYAAPPATECMYDYFGGIGSGPSGSFTYEWGASAYPPMWRNRARLKTASAVDAALARPVPAGIEMYLFTICLKKADTVGPRACGGCTVSACIVFNSCRITRRSGGGDYFLTGPAISDYITWQGGYMDMPGPYGWGCPGATAAHETTWGTLKTLYR